MRRLAKYAFAMLAAAKACGFTESIPTYSCESTEDVCYIAVILTAAAGQTYTYFGSVSIFCMAPDSDEASFNAAV